MSNSAKFSSHSIKSPHSLSPNTDNNSSSAQNNSCPNCLIWSNLFKIYSFIVGSKPNDSNSNELHGKLKISSDPTDEPDTWQCDYKCPKQYKLLHLKVKLVNQIEHLLKLFHQNAAARVGKPAAQCTCALDYMTKANVLTKLGEYSSTLKPKLDRIYDRFAALQQHRHHPKQSLDFHYQNQNYSSASFLNGQNNQINKTPSTMNSTNGECSIPAVSLNDAENNFEFDSIEFYSNKINTLLDLLVYQNLKLEKISNRGSRDGSNDSATYRNTSHSNSAYASNRQEYYRYHSSNRAYYDINNNHIRQNSENAHFYSKTSNNDVASSSPYNHDINYSNNLKTSSSRDYPSHHRSSSDYYRPSDYSSASSHSIHHYRSHHHSSTGRYTSGNSSSSRSHHHHQHHHQNPNHNYHSSSSFNKNYRNDPAHSSSYGGYTSKSNIPSSPRDLIPEYDEADEVDYDIDYENLEGFQTTTSASNTNIQSSLRSRRNHSRTHSRSSKKSKHHHHHHQKPKHHHSSSLSMKKNSSMSSFLSNSELETSAVISATSDASNISLTNNSSSQTESKADNKKSTSHHRHHHRRRSSTKHHSRSESKRTSSHNSYESLKVKKEKVEGEKIDDSPSPLLSSNEANEGGDLAEDTEMDTLVNKKHKKHKKRHHSSRNSSSRHHSGRSSSSKRRRLNESSRDSKKYLSTPQVTIGGSKTNSLSLITEIKKTNTREEKLRQQKESPMVNSVPTTATTSLHTPKLEPFEPKEIEFKPTLELEEVTSTSKLSPSAELLESEKLVTNATTLANISQSSSLPPSIKPLIIIDFKLAPNCKHCDRELDELSDYLPIFSYKISNFNLFEYLNETTSKLNLVDYYENFISRLDEFFTSNEPFEVSVRKRIVFNWARPQSRNNQTPDVMLSYQEEQNAFCDVQSKLDLMKKAVDEIGKRLDLIFKYLNRLQDILISMTNNNYKQEIQEQAKKDILDLQTNLIELARQLRKSETGSQVLKTFSITALFDVLYRFSCICDIEI